tara:strand:- start:29 stop:370 length:342 start_codon:yes stop_codon:yes gene_type:complete
MSTEGGWRAASEVKPDLIDNRETITTHSFDVDADPAQIVWAKRELTVDERKGAHVDEARVVYQAVVEAEMHKEMDEYPSTQYDAAVVSAAQDTFEARITAISAAITHEEVDAL